MNGPIVEGLLGLACINREGRHALLLLDPGSLHSTLRVGRLPDSHDGRPGLALDLALHGSGAAAVRECDGWVGGLACEKGLAE